MEEIARGVFQQNLEQVAPALASRGLVPVLTHYWFTGKSVMAYNDQIAISVPMATEFKGAVAGETLLRLVRSSTAKKVKMELDEEVLHVSAGRAKIKIPSRAASEFVFDMPKLKHNAPLPIDAKPFMKAIQACLETLRNDTAVPDQLGVTIIPTKKGLHFFSTDSAAITYEYIETPDAHELTRDRIIIPASFCKEMVKRQEGPDVMLEQIKGDYVLFKSLDDLYLFGRLLDTSKPYEFETITKRTLDRHPDPVPIPEKFADAVERSSIILDAAFDNTVAVVSVKDGELHFHSQSDRGEVKEYMPFGDHPDVEAKFEPKHLKLGCDGYKSMSITDNSVIFYRRDVEEGTDADSKRKRVKSKKDETTEDEGKLFVSATE